MAVETRQPDVSIVELSPEEGKKLLDRRARQHLNISGDEFIQKWDAQNFEDSDDPLIVRLALLIPFARR
jgi:hypothetical protein